ncbi:hypothetical protein ACHAXT_012687 [Thalassiosira profunda]
MPINRRHHDGKQQNLHRLVSIAIYLLSIVIYLHPLTSAPTPSESPTDQRRWKLIYRPAPQLDELHILSTENHDITPQPTTSWTEAWHNDYWGRPLSTSSSHKSWRPVAVWSFRFGKGGDMGRWLVAQMGMAAGRAGEGILRIFGADFGSGALAEDERQQLASELFVHRFVNVGMHAAIVQMVGAVASLLFFGKEESNLQLWTKCISQLLFALHPVHVEAVANVANRPHILALLFNTTIVDPAVPLLAVAVLAALGLLTAETAIFQFPAIVLTMTAIRYGESSMERTEKRGGAGETPSQSTTEPPIAKTFVALLPRYILLVLISTSYLLYRHHNDSLSIPKGLLRPAENPFYNKLENDEWTLLRRAMNYSYVLSLHIMKAVGVEIVGFSHEYGFDCIPEIETFRDRRLLLPLLIAIAFGGVFAWSWSGWKMTRDGKGSLQSSCQREDRVQRMLFLLVFYSWMATLFPISGILKVGTFVADRIAVASSFGTCIFGGRLLAFFIMGNGKAVADSDGSAISTKRQYSKLLRAVAPFLLILFSFAKRTHRRASQWMDAIPMFESSLEACPRSIKSNLEMSKLYSGLVPHELDLERSLDLIRTAESIDPGYCDVHQQYAHVFFQQARYKEFEEEMVDSLMCPFTMGQAINNWNKYWQVVLDGGKNAEAKKRYDRFMTRIKAEVAKAQQEDGKKNGQKNSNVGMKEEL